MKSYHDCRYNSAIRVIRHFVPLRIRINHEYCAAAAAEIVIVSTIVSWSASQDVEVIVAGLDVVAIVPRQYLSREWM